MAQAITRLWVFRCLAVSPIRALPRLLPFHSGPMHLNNKNAPGTPGALRISRDAVVRYSVAYLNSGIAFNSSLDALKTA